MKLVVDTCIGNDRPRSLLQGEALQTNFLNGHHRGRLRPRCRSMRWSAPICMSIMSAGTRCWRTANGCRPSPSARYLIGRKEYEHWSGFEHDETQTDHGRFRAADLRRRPGRDGGDGPPHLAGNPADADHRPYARPCQRGDRIQGRDRRHHRRHGPSPLPDRPPRLGARLRHRARTPPRATRKAKFAEWADKPILVIGTHFAAPTAGHIVKDGESYRLKV